jgi:putative aldouronate transport system substrate-binding protein
MRANWANDSYLSSHCCTYSYLPQWDGTSKDGVNAMKPGSQPGEFIDSLSAPVRTCFDAYGCTSYCDFLHSEIVELDCWYPMYSFSNQMDKRTPGGEAFFYMSEIKHQYLPRVIIADDFESEWNKYLGEYKNCKPETFLAEMQEELDRRIAENS